ncbi:hypothetical protein KDW_07080 [Dictyobacter vulcani]|uniref:Uncharacterized protein n=1 Tax=Dictyobacter vulcani TaxID=2607529 RepID=A0A5J4KMY3_9CHLR|nr:hypothetical protein [Dictyobacter vulcani]GER86546.1 hypothetical protein KDW_07080 [Dictyobacter vulcani]
MRTSSFKPHVIGLLLVLIAVVIILMLSLCMTGAQEHFFASAIHPDAFFPYN